MVFMTNLAFIHEIWKYDFKNVNFISKKIFLEVKKSFKKVNLINHPRKAELTLKKLGTLLKK